MTIEIVAIISPAPGKADRVASLLQSHAAYVRDNEPGCLKYQLHKQTNGSDLVMLETYKDQAAIAVHGKAPKFRDMSKTMKDEGLLAKPMNILLLSAVEGSASKL